MKKCQNNICFQTLGITTEKGEKKQRRAVGPKRHMGYQNDEKRESKLPFCRCDTDHY